jgi:hypothetical protein
MKTSTSPFSKMLLVMFCCLLFTTGYSQSKEETITWLKEKLEQSMVSTLGTVTDMKLASLNECEFVIKVISTSNGWNYYYRFTIPTKDITINEDGLFYFNREAILYEMLENHKGGAVKEKRYSRSSSYIKVANKEADLHNRIAKAFTHLATFCPQKKETF